MDRLKDEKPSCSYIEERLFKKEEELKMYREELKGSLVQVNRDMVEKLEQVRKLSKTKEGVGTVGTDSQLILKKRNEERAQEVYLTNIHRKDAAVLLPEEIWEMILDNLSDWKDLLSCSKVCTLFQTILRPRNPTFLFHQVFPCLFDHLDGETILDCRVICRSWNEGIDNFFENHSSLRPISQFYDARQPGFVTPLEEKGLGRLYTTVNGASRRAQGRAQISVAEYFPPYTHRRNPFLGRDLIIGDHVMGLQWFLGAYGKHIYYLTLYSSGWTQPDHRCLQLLTNYQLRLLPNLRKLRFVGFSNIFGHNKDIHITMGSLPNSPALESLQFENVFLDRGGGPLSMGCLTAINALVRKYRPQLKRLDLHVEDWKLVAHLDWPLLTELHIKGLNWSTYNGDAEVKKSLLEPQIPNLIKLGFSEPALMTFPSNRFVEIINHLATRSPLKMVSFDGKTVEGMCNLWKNANSIAAYAPNITTVQVEHVRSLHYRFPLYEFLLCFPCMENLNIYWRIMDDEGFATGTRLRPKHQYDYDCMWSGTQIRKYSLTKLEELKLAGELDREIVEIGEFLYDGAMYRSNIWELFPKLEVLTFQKDVYTRDGYKKFQERRNL